MSPCLSMTIADEAQHSSSEVFQTSETWVAIQRSECDSGIDSIVWRLISCSSSDDSVWGRLSCFRWEKASRRTIGRVLGTTHMVPSVWCNVLHDEGDSIPKVHRSGVMCSMMKETLFPMLVLKCLGLPINQLRTMVLSVHTYTS